MEMLQFHKTEHGETRANKEDGETGKEEGKGKMAKNQKRPETVAALTLPSAASSPPRNPFPLMITTLTNGTHREKTTRIKAWCGY
jgi:hypothetical protein